jgi:hypothetical protein
MKTMFISQGSSIISVCVVYGLSSLVHHLIAYINPINNTEKKINKEREQVIQKNKASNKRKHTQESREKLNSESTRKRRRRIGIID